MMTFLEGFTPEELQAYHRALTRVVSLTTRELQRREGTT